MCLSRALCLCFRSGRRRSRARAAPQKLPATWQYQRRRGGDHDVPKGAPLRERFACGVRVAQSTLGSAEAGQLSRLCLWSRTQRHLSGEPPQHSKRSSPRHRRHGLGPVRDSSQLPRVPGLAKWLGWLKAWIHLVDAPLRIGSRRACGTVRVLWAPLPALVLATARPA